MARSSKGGKYLIYIVLFVLTILLYLRLRSSVVERFQEELKKSITKIAFLIPIYPAHYHNLYNILNKLKDNNIYRCILYFL
jgi:hypothetical protein